MSVEFFPIHYTHEDICQHALKEIITNQHKILRNQGVIMSKLTDVQGKLTKLQADVTAFVEANSGGASDADLDAIGTQVDAIDAIINPPATPAV